MHIWKVEGVTYTLAYQKTFGSEGEDRTFAIDYLQRPDIVFTIRDDNTHDEFTYLFDSKYRVSTMDGKDASPRDAIDEMHRYRDAILYRKGGGKQQSNREAIGAYVLFPGRSGDRSYDYPEKRKVENIGAIPLLPGEEGEAKLKAFINEIIAKKSASDHLAKDIPTRGTTVVVGKDEGEFLKTEVVYRTYAEGQLDWILTNRMYNLPVREAEKFGITDTESAERKKILYLVSFRGNTVNRTFSLSAGVRRMTKAQLQGIGYPREGRADDEYWVFNLDKELGT